MLLSIFLDIQPIINHPKLKNIPFFLETPNELDGYAKEIELLKLLIEHKGLVLTRSQILDELWGYDYPIIDRTIDTYIKNLRKKLRLNCIVTVKGIGYKYEVVE
mgnify:CR=1 FL=1